MSSIPSSGRLLSLDVFRGITIAGMILVNDPGSWNHVYAPLLHADWHGITPTDLVFPFFLFIVGVSISFSFNKQLQFGKSKTGIVAKASKRSLIIFLLGLFLAGFPFFWGREIEGGREILYFVFLAIAILGILIREVVHQEKSKHTYGATTKKIWTVIPIIAAVGAIICIFPYANLSTLRIPGVLQRIALVFFFCSWIYLYFGWRNQILLLGLLLLGYWMLMSVVPVPGVGAPNLEPETNLGAWLDRTLLGTQHLWSQSKVWDPEGLLSTIPAIGTGIIGMLTGYMLQSKLKSAEITSWIFVLGSLSLFLGLAWDLVFPINKKLWTSSYVLYTGGLGMYLLAICYWLIDVKSYNKWTPFFEAFGRNPITAYVASALLAKILLYTHVSNGQTAWAWIYEQVFRSWLGPYNASLLFAITFVIVIWVPIWYFYKQRIIIKV